MLTNFAAQVYFGPISENYLKNTKCRECQVVFYKELEFWEHLVNHRGLYSCNLCQKLFHNMSQVFI